MAVGSGVRPTASRVDAEHAGPDVRLGVRSVLTGVSAVSALELQFSCCGADVQRGFVKVEEGSTARPGHALN